MSETGHGGAARAEYGGDEGRVLLGEFQGDEAA